MLLYKRFPVWRSHTNNCFFSPAFSCMLLSVACITLGLCACTDLGNSFWLTLSIFFFCGRTSCHNKQPKFLPPLCQDSHHRLPLYDIEALDPGKECDIWLSGTGADCYTTTALQTSFSVCVDVVTTHLFPIEALPHQSVLVESPSNKQIL